MLRPQTGRGFAAASLAMLVVASAAAQEHHHQAAPPPAKQEMAPALGGTLTLAELEQTALRFNPTLAQAAARVEAARGRALQAGLCPNPIVGYVSDEVGSGGNAGQQGAFIEQVIVTGGKLTLSRAKFNQEAVQGEWQALAQQYRVLNGVRLRYAQLLALQQLVDVRAELLKIAEEVTTTAEELVNVGQANKPDLLLARAEARQAGVALANVRVQQAAAWEELAAFVGNPKLAPPTRLAGDLEHYGPALQWDATWGRVLAASPEIQIAQTGITRNEFALRREQVEPIPDIRVGASTQYNFETRSQQVGVQVGVRLPLFDRNQGNILSAHAELSRAHAEVTRVELDLRQRLAKTFSRYQASRTLIEEYRKKEGVLAETKEAFELYLHSFKKRRAAWPQVLIAQRNYFQTRIEYVEALGQMRRAEVALLGLLLVDGVDEPSGPRNENRREQERD